ncbi:MULTISPECIES: hypothetical protein [Frankia]|uniref:hypothetical protein n=1 Tax=Frankia TaxID=1854 RepID=UPI001E5E1DD4|nr:MULTISPECIES: hypothetical protein [Frankia]
MTTDVRPVEVRAAEPSGNRDDANAVAFGVVRFESGGGGLVRDTVLTFPSAADADRFASDRGWSDYQVCPLRFLTESAAESAAGWMVPGGPLEHLVARRRRVR